MYAPFPQKSVMDEKDEYVPPFGPQWTQAGRELKPQVLWVQSQVFIPES